MNRLDLHESKPHHAVRPAGPLRGIATLAMLIAWTAARPAYAIEGASGMYLLGGQSLGAGLNPLPGWYFSTTATQYGGSVGGSIQGGVRVLELEKHSDALAGMLIYAPQTRLLGGQVSLSIAAPYAYLRLSGEVDGPRGLREAAVSGTGRGDTSLGLRLGWKVSPSFMHAVSLTVWAPTGNYQQGFEPSIGHNRWAGDLIWAFTYTPGNHKTEFSAAVGYGINSPNTLTHYRSGNEAHLELGIGRRITAQLEIGVAGYLYRQTTGDSGSGALFGALEGRVSGAGPALNYSMQVFGHGLALRARYYQEFAAKRHFEGDLAMLSATVKL